MQPDAGQGRPLVARVPVPLLPVALLMALAFGLNAVYLGGGFQADDLLLLDLFREVPHRFSHWRGVWSVDDVDAFTSLWWRDADFGGAFWRPLPSLILEGSVAVFGEVALPLHLLSVLLHGVVASLAFLVLRRLSGRDALAFVAALLFVTCEDHSMVVGWIATVTDLLCVTGILAALWAHVRWLEDRRPAHLVASLLLVVLAFACKETAALAPLALVLTSLLMPRGRAAGELSWSGGDLLRRGRALGADPLSWAPATVLLVVLLGGYKLLGLGGMNNLMYVDPLGRPGAYLAHLPLHLPVFWLATLSPLPPSVAMFMPETVPLLAVAGAAAAVAWVALLWPLRRSPLLVWAGVLYLLALLPQAGTDASERGLYFPFVTASVLLAMPLLTIGPLARRVVRSAARGGGAGAVGAAEAAVAAGAAGAAGAAEPAPRRVRLAGWYVLLGVLLPGAAMSAAYPLAFLPSLQRPERDALTALPAVEARRPEHVLLLNTAGQMSTFYPGAVLKHHRREALDLRVLSSCNGVVRIERLEGDSFAIHTDRPGWLSNPFARIVRTRPRLEVGREYDAGLFTATLLAVTPDGRDALSVRFDLHGRLDDPGLLLLGWDGEGYRPVDVAAMRPGQVRTLADTSDVWRSLS